MGGITRTSFTRDNNPRTNLTDIERKQIAIDREIVRRGGLRAFTRLAWPHVWPETPFKNNWHVDAILDHLEATYKREIKQLLINIPPGCGKSGTTCIFGPVYDWILRPGESFLFTSFDAGLTFRDAGLALTLMRSKWFRDRWGNIFAVDDKCAQGHFYNSKGGWRLSTSMEGKTTGHHPSRFVIDDPIKPGAITDVSLKSVKDWWSATASTRGLIHDVARICIMQRLHHADLTGVLLEQGGWTHLCIPMRFEERSRCVTSLPWQDPRVAEGDLMWPEVYHEQKVREEEMQLTPLHVAAQLQQRPSLEQGNVFEREWFAFYDPAVTQPYDQICSSWDCTFKEGDRADFVVGQVWGRKGSQFFLLDEVRKQMSFVDTVKAIKDTKTRWPRMGAVLIEDKANGPAVYSVLKKEVPGIIMITPEGGKDSRANSASVFYQSKNVFYPDPTFTRADGFKPYAWVLEHIEEMANFPMAKYDDRVDAASQALIWMNSRRSNLSAAMATLKGKMARPFG